MSNFETKYLTASRGKPSPRNSFVVREDKNKTFLKVLPISPCFEIRSSPDMSKRNVNKFRRVKTSSDKF